MKFASRSSHFKSLLSRNPKNKFFKVVVGDDKVSITDLQVDVFTSAFIPTPRTPDVAKASYAASRLQNKTDAFRFLANILSSVSGSTA